MASIAAAAAGKTRRAGAPTPAPTNFINYSSHENSLSESQVQQAIATTGVAPWYARIIAPLAFGGAA